MTDIFLEYGVIIPATNPGTEIFENPNRGTPINIFPSRNSLDMISIYPGNVVISHKSLGNGMEVRSNYPITRNELGHYHLDLGK
jgi:hypothetical protein